MSHPTLRVRPLLSLYCLVMAGVVIVGCTSREEPAEVLTLCGNHSCGNLAMITTDTTSDGYQYLDASISPDGQRILFSADWAAVPAAPRPPEDVVEPRQVCLIANQPNDEPVGSIMDLGATLVRFGTFVVSFGGSPEPYDARDVQKNDPIWAGNDSIILSMFLPRGNRLILADISDLSLADPKVLYYEPEDSDLAGRRWQHFDPALSGDRHVVDGWLVFTRFGCVNPRDPSTCTQQAIWALQMSTVDDPDGPHVVQVTSEAAEVIDPAWYGTGRMRKLVFAASMDLIGESGGTGTEIFTIDFDTTAAANGSLPLDNNLRRITTTTESFENPLDAIRNYGPQYSSTGDEIFFVSTRRAPAVTLYDRNIWRVPADGSREPALVFFSRYDDVDPTIDPYSGGLVICSSMGFPDEMLDRFEREAYARIDEADTEGVLSDTEIAALAREERQELEFFAGVMSHIFIFSDF